MQVMSELKTNWIVFNDLCEFSVEANLKQRETLSGSGRNYKRIDRV